MRTKAITWLLVIACLIAGVSLGDLALAGLSKYSRAQAAPVAEPGVVPTRDGAIGDFVWYDADGDGIQDIGEPGIPNVMLALYSDDDGSGTLTNGDTLVMTTMTGADGGYLFGAVSDGVYLVDVLSDGLADGPLAGMTRVVGNQAQPRPTAPINMSGGYIYRDADFGYRRIPGNGQAIIGDAVWYDGTTDGVQRMGEPGIAGVQVCATPTGGGEATCAATDAAGRYLLVVPAGSYVVAPTSGVPTGLTPSTAASRIAVAAAGQQVLTADFGYQDAVGSRLGAIGNLVFKDDNANGVFDAGETLLAGISVDLIRDIDGNGVWDGGEPIIATALSASALDASGGNYYFTGVPAGAYLVHVSATNAILLDYFQSPPGATGADNQNQDDPYPVNLAAGATNLTADFGHYLAGYPDSGVIGNLLWIESDGNGAFQFTGSDIGQAGVTIELSQGGDVVAATTTGASGRYSFLRLPAATYSVQVSDDFNVLAGLTPTRLGAAPGQDNNNQTHPYTLTLTADQYAFTADFGYFKTSRLGAIGDLVWYDVDGDGVEDLGERGIPNVRVAAYLDVNGNGILDAADTLFASTVTDAVGGYLLAGLPAGSYFVDVLDAANPNGPLGGLTHRVGMQSQPDPTAPINLAAGQIYKDADFGYIKTPAAGKAVVGDLVWYDGDRDGVRKPTEPGIPGVTIAITDVNGVRIASGVTDAAGGYRIEVPAGSGYVVGPDWAASPALAGLAATSPAPAFLPPLAAGQQWLQARFGIGEAGGAARGAAVPQGLQGPLLGAIGTLVFLDADRNGVFGAGDAPLGGVTVALIRDSDNNRDWDPGEPIIATATTSNTVDANGANYLFTGVPAGSYLVHVTDTAGVLTDYSRGPLGAAGSDGASQADPYPVALAAGANHLAADFGFYRAAGLLASVIGNQVWGETDGDGLFNLVSGDLGVAGVTVALLQEDLTVAATTTGADGTYAFVGQPAAVYQVEVSDDFGVLVGYAPTTTGPQPGQDQNNQAQPYTVTVSGADANLTADFGYRTGLGSAQAGATYAISLHGGEVDVRPGTTIVFTVRITNTGTAWITYLPLQLTYSNTYVSFLNATPASADALDDGLIQWHDLTAAFSALAPGAAVTVTARFSGMADTSRLPGWRTYVTSTVRGAWANPTGPSLLGTLVLMAEQSRTTGIRILLPTGVMVAGLAATRTPDGVAVAWQTANEARLAGFEVLRRTAGGGNAGPWRVVSPAPIPAEYAGASQGTAYTFTDRTAIAAERYEYELVALLLDGGKVVFGPTAVGR